MPSGPGQRRVVQKETKIKEMRNKIYIKPLLLTLLNIAIVLLAFGSWWVMLIGVDTGTDFSSARLVSLKYFTVLSNLLMGIASLFMIPWEARSIYAGEIEPPNYVYVLKLAGTVSVSLTFLVVMTFLGPLFGYPGMFKGVNLHMHLTVPVLAFLVFCFGERTDRIAYGHTFTAIIPMVIYGIFYLCNILINGVGTWPNTNDWYGFAQWGLPASFLILFLIILVTWLIALGEWRLNRGNARRWEEDVF